MLGSAGRELRRECCLGVGACRALLPTDRIQAVRSRKLSVCILASLERVVRFSNIIEPFRLFILCCKHHSNSLTIYLMKYVQETGDQRAAGVKLQCSSNPGRWGILDVPPVRSQTDGSTQARLNCVHPSSSTAAVQRTQQPKMSTSAVTAGAHHIIGLSATKPTAAVPAQLSPAPGQCCGAKPRARGPGSPSKAKQRQRRRSHVAASSPETRRCAAGARRGGTEAAAPEAEQRPQPRAVSPPPALADVPLVRAGRSAAPIGRGCRPSRRGRGPALIAGARARPATGSAAGAELAVRDGAG